MVIQIVIGSALMLASILIAGGSLWLAEVLIVRARPWLSREPHLPKLALVVCVSALWIIGLITAGVWLWAATFRAIGVFGTMEESVYFSMVAYTTLGFGDVLLPQDWRLLAGMSSANGLLNFGLLTAVVVEVLRHVRLGQIERRRRPPE
jgi:hypothetical protein